MRIGLSDKALAHVQPSIESLFHQMGMAFCDDDTHRDLRVDDARGLVSQAGYLASLSFPGSGLSYADDCLFLVDVPPWWEEKEVKDTLGGIFPIPGLQPQPLGFVPLG